MFPDTFSEKAQSFKEITIAAILLRVELTRYTPTSTVYIHVHWPIFADISVPSSLN